MSIHAKHKMHKLLASDQFAEHRLMGYSTGQVHKKSRA